MRVVNTDNFGGDYPDEKFVSESLSKKEAEKLANKLNKGMHSFDPRYHIVVEDDYELIPGFTP